MKPLLFALLVCASISSFAQDATELSISEVVEINGATQKDLYGRAKLWFADAFKSAKDVIQTADIEVGQIVGKALFEYSPKNILWGNVGGVVKYSVKVFVKDGKYKYEITDFSHEKCGTITTAETCPCTLAMSKSMNNKIWEDIKKRSKEEAEMLANSLKKTMGKKAANDF